MRRRTLATLLALAGLIALVAIVPQTPPGRAWLLGRVRGALQGSGIHLAYQSSSGNPWTGVRLADARVDAPGLRVSAATVAVHYFLPSLITGDLPLSVTLHGVRGSIDVAKLGALSGGRAGRLPITPVLQELSVSDASVTVQQVPYTIPSGAVSDIRVHQRGSSLELQAHIQTADGTANASGVLDLNGPSFDGSVEQADVTLARHWFPGASGGTFSGPIHVGADGIRGDFTLRNGSLHAIGLAPTGIHGHVELRYPLVTADLQGTALGGPVHAQGTVNVAARHWEAHAQGSPQLLTAAAWLGRSSLPATVRLPLAGSADTTLDVSGWTEVHLTGTAAGSGRLGPLPLTSLQSDFTYDSRRGVTVQATGEVSGGSTVVTATSGPAGTRFDAKADQVSLAPGQRLDAVVQVQQTATGLGGHLKATDHATLPDRHASVTLDAGLNSDGWQGVVQGSDDLGATLEGAVALSGSHLSGELRAHDLSLPGVTGPINVALRADGAVSALPLTATLGGTTPITAGLGGETLGADLSGRVHATLEGTRLRDLQASLGPLSLGGAIDLAPFQGTLSVHLGATPLRGPVTALLAVDKAALDFGPSGVRPSGTVDVGTVRVGPVAVAPGPLTLAGGAPQGPAVRLASRDGGLTLDLAGGALRATLSSFPVVVAGRSVTVDGGVQAPLAADILSAIQPDLSVRSGTATLTLRPATNGIATHLSVPSGEPLGPVTLARALVLDGTADPSKRTASLTGTLGDLPLKTTLAWPQRGARADLAIGGGQEPLHASLTAGGWSVTGTLPLGGIGAALGWPLAGQLRADLRARGGPTGTSFNGEASIQTTAPVPATIALSGHGGSLKLDLGSQLAGQELRATGTLMPTVAVEARAGSFGPILLNGDRVHGSGTLAARALGPKLDMGSLPWQIDGTLAPLSLELTLGQGHASLQGDRLAVALQVPLRYAGRPLDARVATGGSGATDPTTGAPWVRLSAGLGGAPVTAALVMGSGDRLISVTGTPSTLQINGLVPAELAGAPLPSALRPAGEVSLQGQASLVHHVSYQVDASWKAGGASITGTVTGTASTFHVTAEGAGLAFHGSAGSVELTAHNAELGSLLGGTSTDATLNGTLSYAEGGWSGALQLAATAPVGLDATVSGKGPTLEAALRADLGPVHADASGTVLPAPGLTGRITAFGGAVRLDARSAGSWRDPVVTGSLATTALRPAPWLSLPARKASLRWAPATGTIAGQGDGFTLNGTLAALQATLTLPVLALGVEQTLALHVSGPAADPTVDATLAGSLAHGTLTGAASTGFDADLTVAAQSLGRQLGTIGTALRNDARITGHIGMGGTWSASVATALRVSGRTLPLRAQLEGQAARYHGRAVLDAPSTTAAPASLAVASLDGTAGDLAASVDLSGVDYAALGRLLGVPLQVTATGSLHVETAPLAATLQIRAMGDAAGRPLSLTGHAGTAEGIDLKADYGTVSTTVAGSTSGPLDVAVTASSGGADLKGTLSVGATLGLSLSGTAEGLPASLAAGADLTRRNGSLRASLGHASFTATLAPTASASILELRLDAPPDSLSSLGSGLAGTASARLSLSGTAVSVETLRADGALGSMPWTLALSGTAYPTADLHGTLSAPAWKTGADLTLAGPPRRLALTARVDQLTLAAHADGAHLSSLRLDGSASLAALARPVEVSASRFGWTASQGFTGTARLQAPGIVAGLPGSLTADLTGNGSLTLRGSAGPAGHPWIDARARAAANPFRDPTLQGTMTLDVPLPSLAGVPAAAALDLTGAPTLGGTWTDPTLQGPIALKGALQAQGTLSVEGTHATLDLNGGGVKATASYRNGAWDGSATLTDVSLTPWDARLAGATVSLQAEANGGGGNALNANVTSLDVTAPGATLTGSATLGAGVRVALQVQADLSAMHLPGPPLLGVVRGPLVLAAPSLADVRNGTLVAVLDIAKLGTEGLGGSVAGTLQVGGTPADPTISATLQGSGELHGQLRVDTTPAHGLLDLHSTLSYRAVDTDLGLVVRNGRVSANGHARVGNAAAALSNDAQGRLVVQGSGALQGWRATVAGDLGSAHVQGAMASLGADAGGNLDLTFGAGPWLQGSIQQASIAGVALGDLRLTSQSSGAAIQITGPHLAGSVEPEKLAWHVTLKKQPLATGVDVSGDASGTGTTGSATLALAGTVGGSPLALKLRAGHQNALSLDASGAALGGNVALQATRTRTAGWQGTVSLTGASLGSLAGSLQGTLRGSGLVPTLDGQVSLQGAVQGSAHVQASPSSASVAATLHGRVLGGSVHVKGTVLPTPDLAISTTGTTGASHGSVRVFEAGGALRADGSLTLASGPALVTVTGSGRDTPVGVGLRLPAVPGLAFHGELPTQPAAALLHTLRSNGLVLTGARRTRGRLAMQVAPEVKATLEGVQLDLGGTTVSASGSVGPGGGDLRGALTLPAAFPVDHVGGASLPYQLALEGGHLTLQSDGELGSIHMSVATAAGRGTVRASLHTLGADAGTATVDLAFDPTGGPSGTVALNGVQVARAGLPVLTLAANVTVGSGQLSGTADVSAPHGGMHLDGHWGLGGWLPATLAPGAPTGGDLEARVSTFQLASLPTVARLVPNVSGEVSGVAQLHNDTVVAQLVAPGFTVAGTALPLEVQLSGPLRDLSAHLKFGRSVVTATLQGLQAKGLVTFRRFPAQVLAEATAGPTDIQAEVDGVLRFDVPFSDPASGYLRMATESLRLERAGVVTTGSVACAYNDRSFTIDQASFEGRGTWQAQGSVGPGTLDLRLSADHADFGPLLGLVPMFARYGVSANGSVTLIASGSPATPDVTLSANALDAQVAGTHYRLDHADVALKGSALTASATVEGVAPLGGSLAAHGSAQLTLAPLALRNTDFRFTGSARVPVFGTVTQISGGITQPPGSVPQLAVSGQLGNPFTIQGSLAPFDVRLRGKGLNLQALPLLVTSSAVDANVEMKATRKGLALSGELDASEIRMNLGAGPQPPSTAPAGSPTPASKVGATGATSTVAGSSSSSPESPPAQPGPRTPGAGIPDAQNGAAPSTTPGATTATNASGAAAPASSASSQTGSKAALKAVIFDQLHLRAPQRVLLDASFGSMEAALDLTLTGTAAAPALSGTATALRGSLRFGGRDFTVDSAVATFQPTRGVYPSLQVQAHTTFDKRRVLSGTTDVSFAAPRDSNTFTVSLAFSGQVQPAKQGPSPVTFDISPTLSSDATVQTGSGSALSSPRPLTDPEMLSLITLGRLEVKPELAGQAGIGTAVAQSAIDTAVNVLVVNELQNALSKALGLDVVEIRTTPLSSLLDNSGQPFGVSLRVGGYLTPQLFASYRLGNLTATGESYAFTNEVSLSYDLGPLNFDLSGQLSFPDAASTATAVPQLGVGLRYAFTPNIGLEAGVDLSNVSRQARFGVSFRW
jgi:hypothetical protein